MDEHIFFLGIAYALTYMLTSRLSLLGLHVTPLSFLCLHIMPLPCTLITTESRCSCLGAPCCGGTHFVAVTTYTMGRWTHSSLMCFPMCRNFPTRRAHVVHSLVCVVGCLTFVWACTFPTHLQMFMSPSCMGGIHTFVRARPSCAPTQLGSISVFHLSTSLWVVTGANWP